ncbi:MAG: thiamine-phosphate kinase [Candidatus Margulisbacteria bacterium]|nr:thiamine-phosphate kinase [Candidatus Margulisiibacteriota bacterium]
MNEFQLIDFLAKDFPVYQKNVQKGIGDDCAVWKGGKKYIVFTTDTMVEGDHFLKQWFSPEQIGARLAEINLSDIAAMGASPKFLFVSLILDKQTSPEWCHKVYQGIKKSITPYKISLLGGNITHGKTLSLTASVIGESLYKPIYRSGARHGDLLAITGTVGDACVARLLLKQNDTPVPALFKKLAEPKARIKEAQIIKKYASSMIDISDGIASEARHIAKESETGVSVLADKLPFSKAALNAEPQIRVSLVDCALRGGEDYELMFTATEKNYNKLIKEYKLKTPLTVIGTIIKKKKYCYQQDSKEYELPSGFDHFQQNINL